MSVTNDRYLRAVLGLVPGEQEVLPVLEQRCDAKDGLAQDLYWQTIANLARGLGIAINLLNPSIIVLGGIYAQASQKFVKDLESELKLHAQEELTQDLHMQCSQLGRSGALQGAAIVAFDRLLRDPATYRRILEH
jgi:predicted NBD/HSP70 family sugar kinase